MAKTKTVKKDDAVNDESTNTERLSDIVDQIQKKTGGTLEKLESEIRSGFRVVEFKDKKYRIYLPKIKDDELLADRKNKLAAELLRNESMMTKDEALSLMEKRGTWDKSKDKEERRLRTALGRCLSDVYLEKAKDKPNYTRLQELAEERVSLEIDIRLLTENKEFFLNSTVESKIDEEIIKLKMILCIKNEDDTPVFADKDAIENHDNKAFVNSITTEAIYFWAGIDQSMFG